MGYAEDIKYLPQQFVAATLHYKIEAGQDSKCFELNESIDECGWNNFMRDTNGFVTELTMSNCNIRCPVQYRLKWHEV